MNVWSGTGGERGGTALRETERRRGAPERVTSGPTASAGALAPLTLVIDGCGPLAAEIADQVRRTAVGRVAAGPLAAHAAESVVTSEPPAAVLLVSEREPHAERATLWWRLGVPVLPVVGRPHAATVGPLVVPGVSACLGCHERTRADLGLAPPRVTPSATPPEETDPLLRPLVAAVAVTVLATTLRGSVALAGVSVDLTAAEPVLRHRYWPPHPRCHCAAAPHQERMVR